MHDHNDNHHRKMSAGHGPGRLNHRISFSPKAHGDLMAAQESIGAMGATFTKSVIARAAIELLAHTIEEAEAAGDTDTLHRLRRLCWAHSSQAQKRNANHA